MMVFSKTTQNFTTITFYFTAALCNGALGLQNGRLKNGQISASSTWPGLHTYRARLHHAFAWCARYNNHNQWLKFDFRRPTKVIGMAIQGRSNAHQWVTRFLLHSSQDNVHWAVYRYKNNDKVRPPPWPLTSCLNNLFLYQIFTIIFGGAESIFIITGMCFLMPRLQVSYIITRINLLLTS